MADILTTVVSYTLAAMAGICFVKGLAVLSNDRRVKEHGRR